METDTLTTLVPVSMAGAVGYPTIDCSHQTAVEESLVLKHDRLFLMVNSHGDVDPPGCCGLGLFHDDTRVLSHYALRFAGTAPALLSAQASQMYSAQVDLAISSAAFGGAAWEAGNSVHIRRELIVGRRLTERVVLTNYQATPVDFWMELEVASDFADLFEVRGWRRGERGQFYLPRVGERSITFAYRGQDAVLRESCIRFVERPTELHTRGAVWRFRLEPHVPVAFEWEVLPHPDVDSVAPGDWPSLDVKRATLAEEYRGWGEACTRWTTDVEEFDAALQQAVVDLRALYVEADGEEVISAGIPWYSAPFGRDSIITSLQTLPLNPQIARDTLRYLASHQGERVDPYTEEQPGRIMHELRRGEMARAGEVPHVPYYGTIDATPLWLVLLHETWRWTGDDTLVRDLLPHAERALEWIDRYGDLDGDGLVEYARTSEKGLVNQGWKDSWDGVPCPDGSLPEPPIALVEVQGYVHDAKMRMAALFDHARLPERARELREQGERLRRQILERYWIEELGTFALALDGEKRPVPTATTNAGHLLWSRVPDRAHATRMAQTLLGPGMFSGWGIRTLSAEHPVFNPMSYHDGSIWPHDNAIVALGLSLAGHKEAALPVLTALHEAAAGMRYHRLPELFCGMERAHGRSPVLYPVSCSPQAWASGALFMLLQAVTGILPDAPARTVHVREPVLPPFLRELVVTGLRVGESRIALQFTRRGERTLANLLEVEGAPLHVVIELS